MADTATSALTALAGTAVLDANTIPIATSSTTKSITPVELMIAMQLQGATKMVFGEPADGTILAGTGVFWVDTTASPQTFNCKTRDTSSPEAVINFVLG